MKENKLPPIPQSPVFPLAALVGQREMVEALIILAIDPSIGGLLLVGEKGTAKSTAARALAEILPPRPTVAGCPNGCAFENPGSYCPDCLKRTQAGATLKAVEVPSPFRTIPLGVTEDRLLGGLDWEQTLGQGRPVLTPGLLGEAHGGLIYIDEVNLLENSLAHLLLDAASSGQVTLEREGLSASYPAQVALLATMNPEEGRLGPQLADRFALTVTLAGETDPRLRAEVVKRRLAFEADPASFYQKYAAQTKALAQSIQEARAQLARIQISPTAAELITRLALTDRLAGHRGDLALAKTARARAAWLGRSEVGPSEVLDIAALVLSSRRRQAPAGESLRIKVERVEKAEAGEKLFEAVYVSDGPEVPPEYKESTVEDNQEESVLQVFKSGESFRAITPKKRQEVGVKGRSGRRTSRETAQALGRACRTTARRLGRPLSLSATLRAAAPYQASRRHQDGPNSGRPLILTAADFREKVYRQKTGRLVIFMVDSSGSIGTLYRMEEAKAAALALLSEAYQKRDRVALIAFYDQKDRKSVV